MDRYIKVLKKPINDIIVAKKTDAYNTLARLCFRVCLPAHGEPQPFSVPVQILLGANVGKVLLLLKRLRYGSVSIEQI
jgi:hypothetical protein